MLSGTLIKIPDTIPIERLNGLTWEREERNFSLRSVIQFQEASSNRNASPNSAMAIHQRVGREVTLGERNGIYFLDSEDVVRTVWANIQIIAGLIIVDRGDNTGFVKEIINRGLFLPRNTAHNVYIDTSAMARDHPDQWIRGFSDRQGRVSSGTVYGNSVERDSIFGPEIERSRSKTIGWYTNFFGQTAKVRVSPEGSILVLSYPTMNQFIDFIQREIMPYVISLHI